MLGCETQANVAVIMVVYINSLCNKQWRWKPPAVVHYNLQQTLLNIY